jgi:hypothetical protein
MIINTATVKTSRNLEEKRNFIMSVPFQKKFKIIMLSEQRALYLHTGGNLGRTELMPVV